MIMNNNVQTPCLLIINDFFFAQKLWIPSVLLIPILRSISFQDHDSQSCLLVYILYNSQNPNLLIDKRRSSAQPWYYLLKEHRKERSLLWSLGWSFGKWAVMGDPRRHHGCFNTKSWSNDLDDLGVPPWLWKPPI